MFNRKIPSSKLAPLDEDVTSKGWLLRNALATLRDSTIPQAIKHLAHPEELDGSAFVLIRAATQLLLAAGEAQDNPVLREIAVLLDRVVPMIRTTEESTQPQHNTTSSPPLTHRSEPAIPMDPERACKALRSARLDLEKAQDSERTRSFNFESGIVVPGQKSGKTKAAASLREKIAQGLSLESASSRADWVPSEGWVEASLSNPEEKTPSQGLAWLEANGKFKMPTCNDFARHIAQILAENLSTREGNLDLIFLNKAKKTLKFRKAHFEKIALEVLSKSAGDFDARSSASCQRAAERIVERCAVAEGMSKKEAEKLFRNSDVTRSGKGQFKGSK